MGDEKKRRRHLPSTGRRIRRSKQSNFSDIIRRSSAHPLEAIQREEPPSIEHNNNITDAEPLGNGDRNCDGVNTDVQAHNENNMDLAADVSAVAERVFHCSRPGQLQHNDLENREENEYVMEENEDGMYAMEENEDEMFENAGLPEDSEDITDALLDPISSSGDKEHIPDDLLHRFKRFFSWRVMGGLAMVCGTKSMTVQHYESVRRWISWGKQDIGKRRGTSSYSHLQRNVFPYLRRFSYPGTTMFTFDVDAKKSGAAPLTLNAEGIPTCATKQVRVVIWSEWMRRDICSGRRFKDLCMAATYVSDKQIVFDSVENSPIVRNREAYTSGSDIFFSRYSEEDTELVRSIPQGSRVEISLAGLDDSDYSLLEEAGFFVLEQKSTLRLQGVLGNPSLVRNTTHGDNGDSYLVAGDVQVQVSFDWAKESYDFMIVNRMVVTEDEGSCGFMVFRKCKAVLAVRCRSVKCIEICRELPTKGYSPSFGTLKDGRSYFVYRVLLYSDDFQPYNSKKGSAGGFYMLPLNLPLRSRASAGAVRVLSLTPPGVSSNNVLRSLIPDIVKCTSEGVEVTDFSGNPVTLFVDVVGYIGDYPAVTHTLDVLGQNALAPCHLCTFRKYSEEGVGESDYGYTARIHSRNSSFARDHDRMEAVRQSIEGKHSFQQVGLQELSSDIPKYLPLHDLSRSLRDARARVPLTDADIPVVPALFDPYRSALVAPDHLLAGLAQDVINANLVSIPKPQRVFAESYIQDALRRHGLDKQSHIFNIDAIKIHSMALSSTFNVLMVAPFAFSGALRMAEKISATSDLKRKGGFCGDLTSTDSDESDSNPDRSDKIDGISNAAVQLLADFQKVVAATYFYPISEVDGQATINNYNADGGQEILGKLARQASQYVGCLNEVCKSNDAARRHLNKPNVHRLVELYNHTLPCFGHVRHFQELLFEGAHQPLKRGITNSNQKAPQLSAMDAVLANDWLSRVGEVMDYIKDASQIDDEVATELETIIIGESLDKDESVGFRSILKDTFVPPLIRDLKEHVRSQGDRLHTDYVWAPGCKYQSCENALQGTQFQTEYRECIRALKEITCDGTEESSELLHLKTSFRMRQSKFEDMKLAMGKKDRGGVHNDVLRTGEVIQATVDRSWASCSDEVIIVCGQIAVNPQSPIVNQFQTSFWYVAGLFGVDCLEGSQSSDVDVSARGTQSLPQNEVYAVVIPCIYESESILTTAKPFKLQKSSKKYLLRLNEGIRKVLCLHRCETGGQCKVNGAGGHMSHSASLEEGGTYYMLGTQEGYPSRSG